MFELEFFTHEDGTKPALQWIKDDLSPTKRRALGTAMQQVLQQHGIDVTELKSWGRQLGRGLFEFRVDRWVETTGKKKKNEEICLRVFCHAFGNHKILVLHGYDKGVAPGSKRQDKEIEVARDRLAAWRQAQKTKPARGAAGSNGARKRR